MLTKPPDPIPIDLKPPKVLRYQYDPSRYTLEEVRAHYSWLRRMIRYAEKRAVELVDKNDDGRISVEEAFDAVFTAMAFLGLIKMS